MNRIILVVMHYSSILCESCQALHFGCLALSKTRKVDILSMQREQLL